MKLKRVTKKEEDPEKSATVSVQQTLPFCTNNSKTHPIPIADNFRLPARLLTNGSHKSHILAMGTRHPLRSRARSFRSSPLSQQPMPSPRTEEPACGLRLYTPLLHLFELSLDPAGRAVSTSARDGMKSFSEMQFVSSKEPIKWKSQGSVEDEPTIYPWIASLAWQNPKAPYQRQCLLRDIVVTMQT